MSPPHSHSTDLPGPSSRRRTLLAALAIVVAALAAFAGSLRNGFSGDDFVIITGVEPLLRAPTLGAFFTPDYFRASHESLYRPLATLSHVLDYRLGGRSPFPYHAQTLLWHIGSALLVWALARRLLPGRSREVAVLAGLLFAVHPALSEAVDCAAFRGGVLATFFVLAALRLGLRGTWGGTLAALPCYALALLSRETALALPLLWLGARLCVPEEGRAPRWRLALELVALAAISAAYVFLTLDPMHPPFAYAPSFAGGTLERTLLLAPVAFARYLRLIVAPWALSADYQGFFETDFATVPAGFWPSLLLLLVFLGAVVWSALRRRVVAFGLAWLLLVFVPLISFVAAPVIVAERFLYLPVAGVALAVAGLAALLPRPEGLPGRALLVAGAAAGIACLVLANLRHPVWRNRESLLLATVHDAPRSWSAHGDLGELLKVRGDLPRAAPELELALRLAPDDRSRALLQGSLGGLYLQQKDYGKAAVSLQEAAHAIPMAGTFMSLARALTQLGDDSGAEQAYQDAARLEPRWTQPLLELAKSRRAKGDLAGAKKLLQAAQERNPIDPSVHEALQALQSP